MRQQSYFLIVPSRTTLTVTRRGNNYDIVQLKQYFRTIRNGLSDYVLKVHFVVRLGSNVKARNIRSIFSPVGIIQFFSNFVQVCFGHV